MFAINIVFHVWAVDVAVALTVSVGVTFISFGATICTLPEHSSFGSKLDQFSSKNKVNIFFKNSLKWST